VLDPFASPYATAGEPPDSQTTTAGEHVPQISDLNAHMDSIEKALLEDALARHGHHQRRTAQALGLSYDQMRGLVRKHGLSRRQRRG